MKPEQVNRSELWERSSCLAASDVRNSRMTHYIGRGATLLEIRCDPGISESTMRSIIAASMKDYPS